MAESPGSPDEAQPASRPLEKPRERGVALAAVLVTGVVGVTGPLITWAATRDAQLQAARAQGLRDDRAELRSVLDGALEVLVRTREAADAWNDPWLAPERDTRRRSVAAHRTFRAALTDTRTSLQRLRIRLGDRSRAAVLYGTAVIYYGRLTAGDLPDALRGNRPPRDFPLNVSRARELTIDFATEANRLAGSQFR